MTDNRSCPRDELLAGLELGALSPAEERELRAHLETCDVCRAALDENRAVASTLRTLPAARPSQAARDRAYQAVLRAMEEPRRETVTAPPKATASAPRLQIQGARPAAPLGGFRVLAGTIAAAACLFVVAGLFMTSMRAEREMTYSKSAKAIDDRVTKRIGGARLDEGAATEQLAHDAPVGAAPTAAKPTAPVEKFRPAPASPPVQTNAAPNDAPAPGEPLAARTQQKAALRDESSEPSREATRAQLLARARKIVAIHDLEDDFSGDADDKKADRSSPKETTPSTQSTAKPSRVAGGVPSPLKGKNEAGSAPNAPGASASDHEKDAAPRRAALAPEPKAAPAPLAEAPEVGVFADPGSDRRALHLLADGDAYWVDSSSRASLRGGAVETELLVRILDAHLAAPAKAGVEPDLAWARKALALEKAVARAQAGDMEAAPSLKK